MSRGRRPEDVSVRLSRHIIVNPQTGCHDWTGAVGHNGYGSIGLGGYRGRLVRVHRLAYELANGPIPPGLEIDHLCRNRACCNPEHLEAVTREENIARGNAPHAVNARKTHCKRGHEFTPDNTYMRNGKRHCRACWAVYKARAARSRPADNLSATHAPPPQYFCELCDAPADADCWSYVAQALVCPACLETLAEQGTHE